jgi:hypothetical protein
MPTRLAVAILVFACSLLALPSVSAQGEAVARPEEAIPLPFGEANWDLRVMEQDPVKLVKTAATKVVVPGEKPEQRLEVRFVKFILQFQRDLTIRDSDWTGVRPQPPFLFRFEDENGVTIASETATYDSTLVGSQGARVQLRLTLPDKPVVQRLEVVEPRAFGERITLFIPALPVTLRTKKVVVDFRPYGVLVPGSW